MPTPPTWTVESGAVVNAQGNQVTINIKITTPDAAPAFVNSDVLDVEAMNAYAAANLALIGDISGWRYNGDDGGLDSSVAGQIVDAGISDWTQPAHVGAFWQVTFKYVITLDDDARIAINNGASSVAIDGLQNSGSGAWLQLSFINNTAGPFLAPTVADTDPNLTVSATTVGKLPPSNDAIGDAIKLHADAHAQVVALSGGAAHLATWNDLSGTGNNLTGRPSTAGPALAWVTNGDRPHVDIASASSQYFEDSTPPAITSPATIAAVFTPGTQPTSTSHIVGRRDGLATISWQVYYNGSASPRRVVYQARSGVTTYSAGFDLDSSDSTILFILRRTEDASKTWAAWINGRPVDDGTFANGVNTGALELTAGARTNSLSLTDKYNGELNQLALYDADVTDLELSLVMHQMADRALVTLGTPIPASWQTQPYITAAVAKRLDRRPIAVVNLYGAQYNSNMFGQSPNWRDPGGSADIVANLTPIALRAMYACDQFEIMFNRPGGNYSQDWVISYVFGSKSGTDIVTADQWSAMTTLWDDLHLADTNDDQNKDTNHRPQRRGWFYTGSGLPVDDDGTLDTTGFMRKRLVAPATPAIYKSSILDHWIDTGANGDDRFRCFFLDAAINFYGKVVELIHDTQIHSNFILVGEAIPTDDAARKGGVWFGLVQVPRGPWWKNSTRQQGYDPSWENDWKSQPTYFGVQRGASPDLYNIGGDPGVGSDLKVGDIFKFIVKGATPVSWSTDTHVRVGVAWNYATARVMPSRIVRNPRCWRLARA